MNNHSQPSAIRSFVAPAPVFMVFLTLLACVAPLQGAAFPAPTSTQIEAGSAAFSVVPGVVTDPTAETLYLMAPADTIKALDLDDGRLLWTTSEGAKPLLVFGDYLIAQALSVDDSRGLEIVVLRTADGRAVHRTSVLLPDGVQPSVDEGLGRRFDLQASLIGEAVALAWKYDYRQITGASPDLVPSTEALKLSGQLQLDVASGNLLPLDGAFEWNARRPDLAIEERLTDVEGTQFRSADTASMMTSETIADARVWERYRWQIRAMADGSVRGEIRAPESWAPFLVANTTLIYVASPHTRRQGDQLVQEDRQLRAFDLRNGRALWTHTVRETTYHGPFPP